MGRRKGNPQGTDKKRTSTSSKKQRSTQKKSDNSDKTTRPTSITPNPEIENNPKLGKEIENLSVVHPVAKAPSISQDEKSFKSIRSRSSKASRHSKSKKGKPTSLKDIPSTLSIPPNPYTSGQAHDPIPSLGEEDSQEEAASYQFDPIPRPTYGNDVMFFFDYIYEHFKEALGPQTRTTQMFFQLVFCNNMDELGITIGKKREAIQEVMKNRDPDNMEVHEANFLKVQRVWCFLQELLIYPKLYPDDEQPWEDYNITYNHFLEFQNENISKTEESMGIGSKENEG